MSRTCTIALMLATLALTPPARAAVGGDTDPSFAYPNPDRAIPDSTNAMSLPDGGLIVITSIVDPAPASTSTLVLARIDADGNPVAEFGQADGKLTASLPLRLNVSLAAARDAAGRLLLGGAVPQEPGEPGKAALIRLDAAGALDPSFGDAGVVLFDVPAAIWDRMEQVATLPDGRILATVRVYRDGTFDDYSCQPQTVSLVRFDSDGNTPVVLTVLDSTSTSPFTCDNFSTLSVLSDGEILVGSRAGIVSLPGPDYLEAHYLADPVGARANPGPFAAGMVATYLTGNLMRIYYDDPNEPNRGLWTPQPSVVNPPWLALAPLAGFGDWPAHLTKITSSQFDLYVGFDAVGEAGVARFNRNGTLRTDWGGGDGVAPVRAEDPHEGAGEVRQMFVQPNGDVIVVTSGGFIRKLLGLTGVAHGGFAIEQQLNGGVTESSSTYTLRVSRTGGSSGAVSVRYRVSSSCDAAAAPGCFAAGSYEAATEGEDFEAAAGEFFWDDGDNDEKTIQVRIKDDSDAELVEYFFVQLSQPTGGAVVSGGTAFFGINNSDQPSTPSPPPPSGGASGGNRGYGGGSAGLWLVALCCMLGLRNVRARRSPMQRSDLAYK